MHVCYIKQNKKKVHTQKKKKKLIYKKGIIETN